MRPHYAVHVMCGIVYSSCFQTGASPRPSLKSTALGHFKGRGNFNSVIATISSLQGMNQGWGDLCLPQLCFGLGWGAPQTPLQGPLYVK